MKDGREDSARGEIRWQQPTGKGQVQDFGRSGAKCEEEEGAAKRAGLSTGGSTSGSAARGSRAIAELTPLALALLSDASDANPPACCERSVSSFGVGAGALLSPELGLIHVAILATILGLTDAAPGQGGGDRYRRSGPPVREGRNVESGLNDGICVPIPFTFLSLATQSAVEGSTGALALRLVAEEIGICAGVGIGIAFAGARGLRTPGCRSRSSRSPSGASHWPSSLEAVASLPASAEASSSSGR